jgi:hypothetical protein
MSLSKSAKLSLLTNTLVSSAHNNILVLLLWLVLNVILGKSLI